jgi:hypothetical protein
VTESEPFTPTTPKKTNKPGLWVAVGIVGVAVAGGVYLLATAGHGSPSAGPSPIETSGEATNSPEVSAFAPIEQPPLDSLKLPESLLSDGESVAEALIDQRFTEWVNYGVTPEVAEAAIKSGDIDAYVRNMNVESDKAFADSLFVTGWESIPALVALFNNVKAQHQAIAVIKIDTSFPELERYDRIPYLLGFKHTEVLNFSTNPDGTATLETAEQSYDNRNENTVGEDTSYTVEDVGVNTHVTRTLVVENGFVKVSGQH